MTIPLTIESTHGHGEWDADLVPIPSNLIPSALHVPKTLLAHLFLAARSH